MAEKLNVTVEYASKTEQERKDNCTKALTQYISNKVKSEQKTVDNARQKVV